MNNILKLVNGEISADQRKLVADSLVQSLKKAKRDKVNEKQIGKLINLSKMDEPALKEVAASLSDKEKQDLANTVFELNRIMHLIQQPIV